RPGERRGAGATRAAERPGDRRSHGGGCPATGAGRGRGAAGLDGPGHRAADGRALRARDRAGGVGLLERADGSLRAGAVRRGHARGGGGRGARRRGDGRRRRRLGGGAGPLRPGGPGRSSLHRRRRDAADGGGRDPPGSARARGRGRGFVTARTPLIAGNWKMYKTEAEAEEYIGALLPRLSAAQRAEVAICVPFTDLRAMADSARGSPVSVYAQNVHERPEGPFTGEVSAPMLSEAGAQGVLLGHSERRRLFGESDDALALKVPVALQFGLTPVLCVGESESERDAGETEGGLRERGGHARAGGGGGQRAEVVIAYEPIWAIGTGRVATPEQAQEAIAFIRSLLRERDQGEAERVRILYGGSVNPENAAELLALADVDGALVGGASLQAESFAQIAAATPR